jgi:hypothetical protein
MLLHTTSLYFVFHFSQRAIKREMKNYLSSHLQDAHITMFTFSLEDQKDIGWEGDDEFTINGQMYDVIQKKKDGNKTVVYCVQDKKETALVQHFLRNVKKEAPIKGKTGALTQLVTAHFILAEKNTIIAVINQPLVHCTHFIYFLSHNYSDVIEQPPQTIA